MLTKTKIKLIASVLTLVIALTPVAHAQAAVPVFAPDVVQAALEALKVPTRGVVYNRLTNPFWIEFTASKVECDALIKATEINNETQANTGWLGVGFGLVGGDFTEGTKTAALVASVTAAKECVDNKLLLTGLNYKSGSASSNEATDLAREMTHYSGVSNDLGKRLQDLNARVSATTKDFLKALLTKIALGVTKNLTNEVIDDLLAQYRVSNFDLLADRITTQYNMLDIINRNYSGDAQQQLMIRALAQAAFDNAPSEVVVAQSYAQNLAEEQTGCKRDQLNLSDPNFYNSFAASGKTGCTSLDHLLQAQQLANNAHAQGAASAQSEITAGQGFIPVRSCGEGLVKQKAFEQDQRSVSSEIQTARTAIKLINQSSSASSGSKAQALKDATADLEKLKQKQTQLRTQRMGDVTKSLCEGIDSPATFISNSIDKYLSGYLNNSMDLKSNNLPGVLSFLGDLATNFITDIITGIGDGNANLLTEEGAGNFRSSPPITYSQVFDPSAPVDYTGTNVPASYPGTGGGTGTGTGTTTGGTSTGGTSTGGTGTGGTGSGGGTTTQPICIPEEDTDLMVNCEDEPTEIGDIINVLIEFPDQAGELELSSATLQTDSNGNPSIESDGSPITLDMTGNETQPLSEPFEITSLFTVITVRFTPTNGSAQSAASLSIALPELNEQFADSGASGETDTGSVLGATTGYVSARGPSAYTEKKSGITLR